MDIGRVWVCLRMVSPLPATNRWIKLMEIPGFFVAQRPIPTAYCRWWFSTGIPIWWVPCLEKRHLPYTPVGNGNVYRINISINDFKCATRQPLLRLPSFLLHLAYLPDAAPSSSQHSWRLEMVRLENRGPFQVHQVSLPLGQEKNLWAWHFAHFVSYT